MLNKIALLTSIFFIIFLHGCGDANKNINSQQNSSNISQNISSDNEYEDNSVENLVSGESNISNDNHGNSSDSNVTTTVPNISGNQCLITLDSNGGADGSIKTMYKVMEHNVITDLPINKFINNGYEFTGWSTMPDNKTVEYTDGQLYKVEKNITLYAVWVPKENVYIIDFDFQGNKNTGMANKLAVVKGESITLPSILSYKKNHFILGYATRPNTYKAEFLEGHSYTPHENTRLYIVYSDGRCVDCAGKIKFVTGVNVLESDFETKFADRNEPPTNMPLRNKTAVWNENANWYSVNQYKYNMCWAANASNILLWWRYNNKKYIDEYTKIHKYEGAQFNYYYDDWYHRGHSDLFDKEYKKYWKNDGEYTHNALNWFLKGDNIHNGGGYFKEVFADKTFTYIVGNTTKARFNYFLTDILENNKIAGLYIRNPNDHVITLWGAEYDDEGFIKAIYTTNSQVDGRTINDKSGGLEVDYINYPDESSYPLLNDTTVPVIAFYVFSLGEDIWKEYFEKNNIPLP